MAVQSAAFIQHPGGTDVIIEIVSLNTQAEFRHQSLHLRTRQEIETKLEKNTIFMDEAKLSAIIRVLAACLLVEKCLKVFHALHLTQDQLRMLLTVRHADHGWITATIGCWPCHIAFDDKNVVVTYQ